MRPEAAQVGPLPGPGPGPGPGGGEKKEQGSWLQRFRASFVEQCTLPAYEVDFLFKSS